MAKMVNKEIRGRGRYNFADWSNGKTWQLTKGEDYNEAKNLIISAYNFARNNSLTMKHETEKDGKTIFIQFLKSDKPAKPVKKKPAK